MTDDASDTTHMKVMAGIGYVCLQWALLEHLLLGCIATIETMPLEKTFIMFGSTDMGSRLGVAINLARAAKMPGVLPSRLEAVRKEIRTGLQERRNQVVHGVHADAGIPDAVRLTIAKWKEPRRHEVITSAQMGELGTRLNELGVEVVAIQTAIFEWQLRMIENRLEQENGELAERYPNPWSKFAKYVSGLISRTRRIG
jgi:hypothetical protein